MIAPNVEACIFLGSSSLLLQLMLLPCLSSDQHCLFLHLGLPPDRDLSLAVCVPSEIRPYQACAALTAGGNVLHHIFVVLSLRVVGDAG